MWNMSNWKRKKPILIVLFNFVPFIFALSWQGIKRGDEKWHDFNLRSIFFNHPKTFLSSGTGSLIWVIIAELYDGPARAFGVSSSIAVNTTMIFFTTKYFPLLLETAGPAITYFSFAGVSALMCLFVTICVPETKGKTFIEIQSELKGGKNGTHVTDSSM